MAWRQMRVMFIPKSQKADCTKAKAYCPISLSSFLLKMMEKLLDKHIKEGALRNYPLHQNQYSFTRKWNLKGLEEPTLFNKPIQRTRKVKYLALTWKK
jgi:hypothetical protein